MMIELAAAAMLLANMDPEGVVTTAPSGSIFASNIAAAARSIIMRPYSRSLSP